MRTRLLGILLLVVCAVSPAQAQSVRAVAPTPVKIGVFVAPPFVMKSGDTYSGFTFDLWQQIATDLNLTVEMQQVDTIAQLLDMVRDRKVDVAVANLSITAARYAAMDFSQPYFDSGLRIMIDESRHMGGMSALMDGLEKSGHLRVYAWIGVLMIVATVVLTLVDRRFHPEFPEKWGEGLAESFYHVMSVVTSGSTSHRNLLGTVGRFLGALWLACGVAIVAYVTSSITSVMTASTIAHQINGPADLGGKVVGALKGSTGETFCRDAQLDLQSFATMEEAVDALLKGQITAIVRDAPVLEWYDQAHPELPVTVVGPLFKPEKYGFALPQNSPLTRRISEVLLDLKDRGVLDDLRGKYFGRT